MLLQFHTSALIAWLLIATRLAPLFFLTPLDFVGRLPVRVRLMIILLLSMFVGLVSGILDSPGISLERELLVLLVLGEFSVGLVLSLGLHAWVGLYLLAGRIMDFQTGLGAAGVFNPGAVSQDALLGTFLVSLGVVLFFVLDMHHYTIAVLVAAFHVIPFGKLWAAWPIEQVVSIYGWMFSFALVVAAPIVVAQLLVDMMSAMAGRSMPQFNIYFVMLPVKIMISMVLLAMSAPFWMTVVTKTSVVGQQYWQSLLQ